MTTDIPAYGQTAHPRPDYVSRAAIATVGVGIGLTVSAIHALRIIPGTPNGDLVVPGILLLLTITMGVWGQSQLQRAAEFPSVVPAPSLQARRRRLLTRALWAVVLVGNPLAVFQGKIAGAALLAFGLYAIWHGVSERRRR
ncbi:hypothetical protein [Gemmatimonas aurantiaca]|uniref:hypothetical protein n=1 Tax=Gemmatimonas aurantiaca TaxID=173480 RepID=UPI00301BF3F3